MAIQSLHWHEESLHCLEESLARMEIQMRVLEARILRERANAELYRRQIMEATHAGKDAFDRDRYLVPRKKKEIPDAVSS